jgi:hypothetical protein
MTDNPVLGFGFDGRTPGWPVAPPPELGGEIAVVGDVGTR